MEVVAGLPVELERPGVDQPVAGDPVGWGWLERGGLTDGVDVRVGAGRPLMMEFDPEGREGVELRVGEGAGREGVADGLELVRVGEELLRDGVDREGVEELLRPALLVRWGVDRWGVDLLAEDRWEVDRCVVVRCVVVRWVDVRWGTERALEVRDDEERWAVRWAGSG